MVTLNSALRQIITPGALAEQVLLMFLRKALSPEDFWLWLEAIMTSECGYERKPSVRAAKSGEKMNCCLTSEKTTGLQQQVSAAPVFRTFDSVSVVVPVYNSESTLPELLDRLEPVLASLCSEYEVILINDGSRDASWKIIRGLCSAHSCVRGIDLMRNYGQHNALLCGIRAARFETIVTLDDDLQHPPEEIRHLLSRLDQDLDVVYGFPEQQQHGLLRDLASELTKLALRGSMGAETARHVSAFRAFRTRLRDAFVDYQSPFISIDVVLTWGTTRFDAIKVRHDPRTAGVSNYTLRKLVAHAMNMMTGFSTLPLQFANLMGFLCTLFGLGIMLFVVGRFFLYGASVPGFTFLASIIAIFSGAQLLALGIIGEYLARMHFRMMERPTYAVREQLIREET